MKKGIIIICLLGLFLTAAVTSLKWRQISDAIPTVTEINFVDGVTSAIQTQLNSKLDTASADVRYLQIANGDTAAYYTVPEVDSITVLKADKAINKLQFIVAATGMPPINGDSILTHSYLKNKQVEVIVNGLRLYENYTATNGKLGYRFNSTTGVIVFRPALATTNVVQINIIPNTITAIGLEQNLLRYSEDLTISTTIWGLAGTPTPTIVANQKADLSGNMTLDQVNVLATNNYIAYQNDGNYVPATINTQYTFSFDCDPGTATGLSCRIINNTGSVFYVDDVSFMSQVTAGIVRRVSFTFTTDATSTQIKIYPFRTVSNAPSTLYVGRFQLAKGTTATYVTTTITATP